MRIIAMILRCVGFGLLGAGKPDWAVCFFVITIMWERDFIDGKDY